MQWVIENWVLVLFGGAMVAMHLFGHGHGHKGGRHGGARAPADPQQGVSSEGTDRPEEDRNA